MLTTAEMRRCIADLEAAGLDVTEWTDEAGNTYPEHRHPYAEVRVVLDGELRFTVRGSVVVLGPGDRIDLEPHEPHAAEVGPQGVRFLAGTRRPG